jgi:hypothetical protein
MSTDPELHALIDKADELLVRCERDLVQAENRGQDVEMLERTFQRIDFTAETASLLAPDEVEEYRTAVTAVLGQLRRAQAALPDLVTSVEAARHLLGRARLDGMEAGWRTYGIRFAPGAEPGFGGRDPLEVIRAVAALGDIVDATPAVDRLPSLEDLDPERCYLSWRITLVSTRSGEALAQALSALGATGLTLVESDLPS